MQSCTLYFPSSQQTLGFFFNDLPAVVVAAIAAYTVRAFVFAALRAFHQRRSIQLPHIVASFIATSLGMFSLGYRHRQHLLILIQQIF